MRIFVGYHYGPSDEWVEKLVYRLVRAFGNEVDSGKELYLDSSISEGVKRKIDGCDAVIGVASRDRLVGDFYSTHRWVQDEMVYAFSRQKLFVQLRETQLDPRQGILQGAQYIEYDSANLSECLVKLAEAIGQWHTLRNVPLFLAPPDFAAAVTPLLPQPGFYCQYKVFDRNYDEKGQSQTRVIPTPGGLCVMLKGIARDSLIQVEAGFGNQRWRSDVVNVDTTNVIMKLY